MDEELNSISKEERYELITDKILSMIYDGHMKKGDKMLSENQMAKKLGVSRAHVREVYSALSIVGVMESRRGEGTFFKTSDSSALFKILLLLLYDESLCTADIMEIRMILEVGIAEKAARNRNENDVKELKKCLKNMEDNNDGKSLCKLDNELHAIIGRSCGNRLLMNLSNIVSGLVAKSIEEHWGYIVLDKKTGNKQKTYEQHKELVDAIVNKKPYIAKVIAHEHLEFVEESLGRYKREIKDF